LSVSAYRKPYCITPISLYFMSNFVLSFIMFSYTRVSFCTMLNLPDINARLFCLDALFGMNTQGVDVSLLYSPVYELPLR
jgi:hypothetical protein